MPATAGTAMPKKFSATAISLTAVGDAGSRHVCFEMTAEQVKELDTCLRLLIKKVLPRIQDCDWKLINLMREASLGDDTGKKLKALFYLTRLMANAGGFDPLNTPNDPLTRPFVRSMDLLCEFGLASKAPIHEGSSRIQ
jgi:hypothetical protein